ncbi:MAG: ABC transporter permease [Anaerolineae bacterium]
MAEAVRLPAQDQETGTSAPSTSEKIYVASQWQLMWWRFRRHKLALVCTAIVVLLYLVALFADFLTPYDPEKHSTKWVYAPPQALHVRFENGGLHWYAYEYQMTKDPETLKSIYTPDPTKQHAVLWLVPRGRDYRLLWFFRTNIRLFGFPEGDTKGTLYLFGTDPLGRDVLSRTVQGIRISMSIGLVGVALTFIFGVTLGGFSGLYGGVFDTILQRVIEVILSIPATPLWLGLSAAIPNNWPQLRVYFAITLILSLFGWTGLARVVRGRFLSLREEDFVVAARLSGSGDRRIVFRHLVPSMLSYIIAQATLAIPGMIMAETALSFLGLGLRAPTISLGVLLQDAQNVRTVALAPWLLIPGYMVIVAILCFNFMGDGMRDAADPYA